MSKRMTNYDARECRERKRNDDVKSQTRRRNCEQRNKYHKMEKEQRSVHLIFERNPNREQEDEYVNRNPNF